MMRILPIVMLMSLGAVWPFQPLWADDLTSTFIYQGAIKSGVAPLNGTADFDASLWDAATDGTQIGATVSLAAIEVADGIFHLPLDFGAGALNGQRRWLEIAVRSPSGGGGFTTLAPRQEITAAPYALQTRGLFVNDDKLVGVGTVSPSAALHVFKSDSSPADAAFRVTTDAGSLLSRRTLTFNGGAINVGGLVNNPDLFLMNDSEGNVDIASGGGDAILTSGAGRTIIGGDLASFPSNAECFVNGNFEVRKDNFAGLLVVPLETFVQLNYKKNGTTIVLAHMASGYTAFGTKLSVNKFAAPDHPIHVGVSAIDGNGAHVTNGGVWTNGSDANSKTDYAPVDKGEILEKVAALPVTQWRYKGEPNGVKHIGPTAQDFMAAFGLGESERHIGTVDEGGVALAAIQGLHAKVKAQEAELQAQREIIEKLEARMAELEK